MKENFEEYLKEYKKLPLTEKRKIVFNQLKMLAVLTNSFCKEIGAENEIIVNSDLKDLNREEYTEDDFAEAVLVLTNSIQESVCDFHLKISDIIDNINE